MQSLNWYAQRFRAMTPGEVIWRARAVVRDVADRHLLGLRKRWAAHQVASSGAALASPGYSVSDLPVGAWLADGAGKSERGWAGRLQRRADRIAAGRLSLFDLVDHDLGDPIDWNRDPKSGKTAPLWFAPRIDYRDYQAVGDCKFVWEPNRHHQLVVLGRAYRATGDLRYAQAVALRLKQWLAQCPYGLGMNWRSPLELAIRLINWVWAIDLIRPSGVLGHSLGKRLLRSVYLHLWDISRKYSCGSSANNHRIGEAAGVYIASSYFRELKHTRRWQAESRRILCNEILAQTYPDGGTREQAIGYQFFVLQFFLLAGRVGHCTSGEFPAEYWERLERMCTFLGALGEGGQTPMFGDCDDGYVLDLDADPHDTRPWLVIAATVFGNSKPNGWARNHSEAASWLLGATGAPPKAVRAPLRERLLRSRAFADSGYYLLQCGHRGALDRISVVFDCGSLGYGALAAHGHADALSFTLRAFGVDILVDPGTFDYFTYARWRDYFRSTRAHNTVTIDGVDQSTMLGSFLWGAKAEASCLEWSASGLGGRVCGEHDGYRRLASPVLHRRTLELDGRRRELVVQDRFFSSGRHDFCLHFHLAEHCRVAPAGDNRYEIDAGLGSVTLELDEGLATSLVYGSESPISGWVSRSYHHKVASSTLVGRCCRQGSFCLKTRVEVGQPAPPSAGSHGQAGHTRETERPVIGWVSDGA